LFDVLQSDSDLLFACGAAPFPGAGPAQHAVSPQGARNLYALRTAESKKTKTAYTCRSMAHAVQKFPD